MATTARPRRKTPDAADTATGTPTSAAPVTASARPPAKKAARKPAKAAPVAASTAAAPKKKAPATKTATARKTASAKKAATPSKAPAAKKPAPAKKTAPAQEAAAAKPATAPAAPAPAAVPVAEAAAEASPAKTVPAKKTPARQPSTKQPSTKQPSAKKTPAKKAAATKTAAAAPATRKSAGRRAAAASTSPVVEPQTTTGAAPTAPTGPAHSAIRLFEKDAQRHLVWQAGHACPPALAEAAQARLDPQGHLRPDDDPALPTLLRLAAELHHRLEVDEAVWPQLAADRDARHRLHALEAAYPGGPASPGLQSLLQATALPPYQAEGALFAVVAGRALIADERGLGKRVQAIAAATLWRRHFGLQRVLVLCTPSQRAAWQRAFACLAGPTLALPPQVIEGPLHQRQALWSGDAELRILAPEALDSDAAHIARWAPELLIIDEPQQLPGWAALQAPHALVLCGAPLAEPPALLHDIVAWLDAHRQGALHALQRVQAAREQGVVLDEAELERLDDGLSRLMLQRLRGEVQEQLPPLVLSERLVPLAPPQREAHERLRTHGARLLAGWQRSGFLADSDQWALSLVLRQLGSACHRSDPTDTASALAEATVATLQAQLDDWAATGTQRIALICPQPADREQLAARLRVADGLHWLAAGENPPPDTEVVLQIGVPWRLRRPRRGDNAPTGQQWVYVAAQDSLELGLFDTWGQRQDAPRGPAEPGGQGFLHGQRLQDWLGACALAWQAARTPEA